MDNLSEERKPVVEGVLAHIFSKINTFEELEVVIEHLELRQEELQQDKKE